MGELRDYLIEYSHDVIEGREIACIEHKWACMRFLRDIEREGTEEFPFLFNEEKALRFLRWMALFKHSKGVLQGENIEPAPIQAFNFGNIYGWEHKETKYRRFRKAAWWVAKKNAKSQSLACVASYEAMANGVNASEVYIGATKTKQAQIVWKEIKLQLEASTDLKGKWKIAYGRIEHPKSNSFIEALSKEDGKTGDGINAQCGIIDEYHLHPTTEMYDNVASSMVARPEPLLMVISTAGSDLNRPAYRVEYQYCLKLLDPNNPIENDNYFVMINKLDKDDDVKDESNWRKANPIVCSYPEGVNSIREGLKIALHEPEKMRDFLTKNMNIWVDQKDGGYMDMAAWRECGNHQSRLDDFEGYECIVGVDLSAKIDLTSVGVEFKKDDKYYIFGHSFMPEDTMATKARTDRVPYQLWAEQGWITTTPGAVVDYDFLKTYIKNLKSKYNITVKEVVADPWNALQFMQDMEKDGYTVVEARQGMRTLAGPTANFREMVYSRKIIHNENPVLTWGVGNAMTREDSNANIMLDKSKSTERIDPIAAVMNAHYRAMNLKTKRDLNEIIKKGGWSM
jgi:phage terminase large subunit-like protein